MARTSVKDSRKNFSDKGNAVAGFEVIVWLAAIRRADTWRDLSVTEQEKNVSDLAPLAKLIRSGAGVPSEAADWLADLLDRHSLKRLKNTTPSYARSEGEVAAEMLKAAVDEYNQQSKWFHGPISKKEMDEAVAIKQQRARKQGRGLIRFDGRVAAMELREERKLTFARYLGINYQQFSNALNGKSGSINRSNRAKKAQKVLSPKS